MKALILTMLLALAGLQLHAAIGQPESEVLLDFRTRVLSEANPRIVEYTIDYIKYFVMFTNDGTASLAEAAIGDPNTEPNTADWNKFKDHVAIPGLTWNFEGYDKAGRILAESASYKGNLPLVAVWNKKYNIYAVGVKGELYTLLKYIASHY